MIAFQTVNLFLKIVIFCVISGKQYQCSHCNSTFGAERLLRDHMRYHGKIIYNWKAFISYHIFINRSVGILKCLTWMTGIPSVKPISEFRGALFLWIWKTVSSIKLNVNDFKHFLQRYATQSIYYVHTKMSLPTKFHARKKYDFTLRRIIFCPFDWYSCRKNTVNTSYIPLYILISKTLIWLLDNAYYCEGI